MSQEYNLLIKWLARRLCKRFMFLTRIDNFEQCFTFTDDLVNGELGHQVMSSENVLEINWNSNERATSCRAMTQVLPVPE